MYYYLSFQKCSKHNHICHAMPCHITLSYFSYSRDYLINIEIKATRAHPLFHSSLSIFIFSSISTSTCISNFLYTYICIILLCVYEREREVERREYEGMCVGMWELFYILLNYLHLTSHHYYVVHESQSVEILCPLSQKCHAAICIA